jgi:ATP-dependent DNA helicase PIF1
MKPALEPELDTILLKEQEKYIVQLILNHFSINPVISEIDKILSNPDIVKAQLPEFKSLMAQVRQSALELATLSDRFKMQVQQLVTVGGLTDQQLLQTRIESAVVYFNKELILQLINPVNKSIRVKPKNKIQQQTQHMLQKLRQVIERQISAMQFASTLLKDAILPETYLSWISKHKVKQLAKPDSPSGNQQQNALQLF